MFFSPNIQEILDKFKFRNQIDTMVVELMADLAVAPVAHLIKDSTYSCYDGASGTGGMLTVAQDRLKAIAQEQGKIVSIHLFG